MTRLTDEQLDELERLDAGADLRIPGAIPALLREVRQHRAKERWVQHDYECPAWAERGGDANDPSLCTCGLAAALEEK